MQSEYCILGVAVGGALFGVVQSHVQTVSLIDPTDPPTDMHDRTLICRELGPMLGGPPHQGAGRRHALIIALRRRSVALLIDRVDSLHLENQSEIQMLAPLLAQRLARPWFIGAVIYQDAPLLLLDLRRIATDVMIGAV
ncbi:chemotaxis protein CheW [Candidatus Oscillochloris fontis]|uniref:chemotaxis protein CheW n=1 Tax=Candidatus Oscillochloris fontis TaxID=2496868 RepID=UPI00101D0892|nr:chemotaxis protein CheW [Candidatus Oscillochloris fontis]